MPLTNNVIPLHPAPEVPRIDWCAACWPFWRPAAPAVPVAPRGTL